jgi:predicted kinase
MVVCGLAGSGKSTIARIVGARTGYQILNSDVIRKQLAGVPISAHPNQEYGKGLYDESINRLTYRGLLQQAEDCLRSSRGVILDATFKDPENRRRVVDLSSELRVPVLFVECQASEETTIQRLERRRQRAGEVSDATVEVYLRQRDEFAPLTEIPDSKRVVLNTENDPEEAADQVLDSLSRIVSKSESESNATASEL